MSLENDLERLKMKCVATAMVRAVRATPPHQQVDMIAGFLSCMLIESDQARERMTDLLLLAAQCQD